jgi:hypothetical protein
MTHSDRGITHDDSNWNKCGENHDRGAFDTVKMPEHPRLVDAWDCATLRVDSRSFQSCRAEASEGESTRHAVWLLFRLAVSWMELIWNGTPEERLELLSAVQRNCMCIIDVKGARVSVCGADTMLVQHQRVLNGLLFAGRIANRFIREEWLPGDPAVVGLEPHR